MKPVHLGLTVLGVLAMSGGLLLAQKELTAKIPTHDDLHGTLQHVFQGDHLSQASLSNQVSIEVRDGYRYISANGIPNHETGSFPNAGNPNTISAQDHAYRVTLTPQLTDSITTVRPAFGIALNGVPFEPGTGEFWNQDRQAGWRFEALTGFIDLGTDEHNAHVQPTGSYHYHGVPMGLVQASATEAGITHLGYGADGFPVYGPHGYADANDASSGLVDVQSSYRLKAGLRPDGPGGLYDGAFSNDFEYVEGLGDLDECNGRFGVTPEHPEGIYHYYLTEMFPFIPRCVKGTPDESFAMRGGGHGGGPNGDRPGGGPNGDRPRGGANGRRPDGPPSGARPGGRPNGRRPDGPPPGDRPEGARPPRGGGQSYEPSFPSD